MLFGSARGVVIRYLRQMDLKKSMGRQHLLRALYEILEADESADGEIHIWPVAFRQVRGRRTWTDAQLRRYIRQAYQEGLIHDLNLEEIRLTEVGLEAAAKLTRNHRLWELYLIEYADVAASRVDRDADAVEHILGEHLVATLETKPQQMQESGARAVPASPHPIRPGD
jgi:manganese/zinc/iron transport system permease protein